MINTVLGPIEAKALGKTYMHEHILCGSHEMNFTFGDKWLNKDELAEFAAKQLRVVKDKCGLSTIVDGTPLDLGRDIRLLANVSELADVNIIASCGLYCFEHFYLWGYEPEYLANFFIEECMFGIEGTNIKPGILKCAVDKEGFTKMCQLSLKIMALTKKATGLPLYAHVNHLYKQGVGMLDFLEDADVDLSTVVIGHAGDSDDVDYLEGLLRRGCYIGFDRLYRGEREDMNTQVLFELLERGWGDKITLAHDFCCFENLRDEKWSDARSDNIEERALNLTYVLDTLIPRLSDMGISDTEFEKMLVANPTKVLDMN